MTLEKHPETKPLLISAIEDISARSTLQQEINDINARYASVLDQKQLEDWPNFFIEQGRYQIQSRENEERQFPLCLMDLESQAMMRDRVYGVTQTIFHAPYYMRHIIGQALLLGSTPAETWAQSVTLPSDQPVWVSHTHYAVFRTKPGSVSEVFNVGQYKDLWVSTSQGLKLAWRRCVYDTELVLNSLIYPI
jgi:salicylate 5-hydroxylase small subunit